MPASWEAEGASSTSSSSSMRHQSKGQSSGAGKKKAENGKRPRRGNGQASAASKHVSSGDDQADGMTAASFSADAFFATQEPPSTLDKTRKATEDFVRQHNKAGRRVVLVTSGGTTVPLEQNVVRFLDNFSAGTRGATSAEYFLSAGYAVIFMHRQHSLSPYTRHYSHTTNPFLDLLSESSEADSSAICVKKEHATALHPVLKSYHDAQRAGTLLRLTFVTVTDYLFMLRELSRVMQSLGRRGMYYLAAAVSDFYVPSQKTPEHKIQSGKGSLVIEMDQVPKVLKPMVQEWAPEGYVVSFKLETDDDLLIPKARTALERYGHQVVIGNDLHRRKYEVVFVERLPSGDFRESWLRLREKRTSTNGPEDGEKEIEEDIVWNLSERHQQWIDQEDASQPAGDALVADQGTSQKKGPLGRRGDSEEAVNGSKPGKRKKGNASSVARH